MEKAKFKYNSINTDRGKVFLITIHLRQFKFRPTVYNLQIHFRAMLYFPQAQKISTYGFNNFATEEVIKKLLSINIKE